jgi:hypothetical protein
MLNLTFQQNDLLYLFKSQSSCVPFAYICIMNKLYVLIKSRQSRAIINNVCLKDDSLALLFKESSNLFYTVLTQIMQYNTKNKKICFSTPIKYPSNYEGKDNVHTHLILLLQLYFLEGDDNKFDKRDIAIHASILIRRQDYFGALKYVKSFNYDIPHLQLLLDVTMSPYNAHKEDVVDNIAYITPTRKHIRSMSYF